MGCPQELFVWRKYVAMAKRRWSRLLFFEIVYPLQFSLRAKFAAHPNRLIAEKLNGLEYTVVKQV